MATDADEATNALIARMLAEDDAYEVDAYGLGPEGSSEDEWDAYGRRKKARKKVRPRQKKGTQRKEVRVQRRSLKMKKQKNRPKINVASSATAKKMNPAFT